MEKTSSYCYPSRDELAHYIYSVEDLSDDGLRKMLKVMLCSGFRTAEVLNSYLFYDADGKLILRSLAAKAKKVKIVNESAHHTRFLGRQRLDFYLASKQDVWKSVQLENLFNLDLDEIDEMTNENIEPVKTYIPEATGIRSYQAAFLRLKKSMQDFKIKFKRGREETNISRMYIPSFHFYRKLFAAEYFRKHNNNLLKTIDYMKWRNLNHIIAYVKDY